MLLIEPLRAFGDLNNISQTELNEVLSQQSSKVRFFITLLTQRNKLKK